MSGKIYIQQPSKLEELINNPPLSVLAADSKAVRWLDEIKREIEKQKSSLPSENRKP